MTDVQTKRTPTYLGEIEYETVECASCEQEVLKEEAKRFYAGSIKDYNSYNHVVTVGFYPSNHIKGWLCPYCYDEGPSKINIPRDPRKLGFWTVLASLAMVVWFALGVLLGGTVI